MDTSPPRLGRCKDCDYALFVADPSTVVDVKGFREVQSDGRAYWTGNGYFGRCPQRHRIFALKQIKGTYSKAHKCDSRCLNARGNDCTCSCGGANHGRGYATAHVVESGAPARTPQHIGEVGKHIKGTATVTEKRENVGQYNNTLLVFATDKGDLLKWFAPHALGNTYEVGQKITLRAEVKAHEDHERFGKSTIVRYLEEVE